MDFAELQEWIGLVSVCDSIELIIIYSCLDSNLTENLQSDEVDLIP